MKDAKHINHGEVNCDRAIEQRAIKLITANRVAECEIFDHAACD